MKSKIVSFLVAVAMMACIPLSVYSHSGGTDQNGCHTDSNTGVHHCHGVGTSDGYEEPNLAVIIPSVMVGGGATDHHLRGTQREATEESERLYEP